MSPKITKKNIRGLQLTSVFYAKDQPPENLPELKNHLLLDKNYYEDTIEEIWVYQPHQGRFEIEFADHAYFNFLEELVSQERAKFGYRGIFTASLLAKNNNIITYNKQDLSKHILQMPTDKHWLDALQTRFHISAEKMHKIQQELPDILKTKGLDIREGLKHFIDIPSGMSYDLNPGSHENNHSEARALFSFLEVENEEEYNQALLEENNQEKVQLLNNATCYLYGHWWSCADCSRKLEKAGISKVILSKKWVKNWITPTK